MNMYMPFEVPVSNSHYQRDWARLTTTEKQSVAHGLGVTVALMDVIAQNLARAVTAIDRQRQTDIDTLREATRVLNRLV